MTEIKGFITVEAAVDLSGFSAYYVRELARDGLIEAQKWGRTWMIDRASLLAHKARMNALGTQKHAQKVEAGSE